MGTQVNLKANRIMNAIIIFGAIVFFLWCVFENKKEEKKQREIKKQAANLKLQLEFCPSWSYSDEAHRRMNAFDARAYHNALCANFYSESYKLYFDLAVAEFNLKLPKDMLSDEALANAEHLLKYWNSADISTKQIIEEVRLRVANSFDLSFHALDKSTKVVPSWIKVLSAEDKQLRDAELRARGADVIADRLAEIDARNEKRGLRYVCERESAGC